MSDFKSSGLRVQALDGIRGIAVLMVMVCHFAPSGFPQTTLGRFLRRASEAGGCGVDLFFVLSGFLITGILYEAKTSPHYFRNFYMRRVLRIFPLYYGFLLMFFGVLPHLMPFTPRMQAIAEQQQWLWCYGTNIHMALKGHWIYEADWLILGHFWTLAIEEQFYLVWPLVVFLLSRRALMSVCIGCFVLAAGLRTFFVLHGAPAVEVEVFTPCRIDALTMGAFAALAIRGNFARFIKPTQWSTPLCGLIVLAVSIWRRRWDALDPVIATFGFSVLVVFFAGILLLAVRAKPGNKVAGVLRHPLLVAFGTYSYALYVFHVPLRPLLDKFISAHSLGVALHSQYLGVAARVVLAIAASMIPAILSWHLYEKHFLKLKRFFESIPLESSSRRSASSAGSDPSIDSPKPVHIAEPTCAS